MVNYIPATAQEIVEYLLVQKKFSIDDIANYVGVSKKTVYRIRKGFKPLPKTHMNLIQLYLNKYCNE